MEKIYIQENQEKIEATGEVLEQILADRKAEAKAKAFKQAEAEAKEIAKAAILDRIGLTADELKTILG